ncbi:MAG: lipoprotein [Neisseria sp.]|uniref:LPS translocon maturation chaperone LptM n=1 Tax=Neisseria sp. TaxID=192066 RepID=UPI0026DAA744|nr:lipoprotein [Neisseria sp.]MDO4641840.1 lipoprotein [Neisseria sp.]
MKKLLSAAALLALLSACGYKGDLYLPKENDKAKFGPVQSGLQFESKEPTTRME